MRDNPLISIVIPVYNTENYLEKCIESVINQTYSNIEIILVDDGSTDSSAQICDVFAEKDDRIKVIHKGNGGVSKARNVALGIALGECICFVDSDDSVDRKMVEELYLSLEKNDADIAICDYNTFINNELQKKELVSSKSILNKEEALNEILTEGMFRGAPWCKLFKRDIIEDLSFAEDIFLGEDLLFVVQSFIKSQKIVFIPQPYYNYNLRENSLSTNSFSEKVFTDIEAHNRIHKEVLDAGLSDVVEENVKRAILLINIMLLERLYNKKEFWQQFCPQFQKSLRQHFNLRRLENMPIILKIQIILATINCKLFFGVKRIKGALKRNG